MYQETDCIYDMTSPIFHVTEPRLNNAGSGNVGPPGSTSRKSKSWSLRKMVRSVCKLQICTRHVVFILLHFPQTYRTINQLLIDFSSKETRNPNLILVG